MTSVARTVPQPVGPSERRWSRVAFGAIVRSWRAMGNWRVRASAAILLVLLVLGVFGTAVLGADPRAIGQAPRFAPPSPQWWLGTDALSRSLLPRIFEGTRITFVLSVTAVVLTSAAGTALGLLAGYLGGRVDQVIGRMADVLFAFPSLLLALLISAIIGFGSQAAIVSIVFVTLPLMIRVIRAAALVIREREFVVGAEVGGASVGYVLLVHLLPNVSGALAIQATYACGVAMLVEGSLSYLGLGVQPPDASLGSLVREGTAYLSIAPWLAFAPGVALGLAIFAVNLLGDGLRDLIDPIEPRRLT
jgi:peptide/nickel transport system permease protein